jgi:hypothetical protein
MCMSKPKASASSSGPPTIIDTTAAQKSESSLRRQRSGWASMFKTGSRLGDTRQPSLMSKALLGS